MIRKKIVRKTPKDCFFCKGKKTPDYKEPEVLRKFTSERGKILGRDISGVCMSHQRKLTFAIKRARHLAYLPFVSSI